MNRRRLAGHRAMLRNAFPTDGRTMRGWLREPAGPVAAWSRPTLSWLMTAPGALCRKPHRRSGSRGGFEGFAARESWLMLARGAVARKAARIRPSYLVSAPGAVTSQDGRAEGGGAPERAGGLGARAGERSGAGSAQVQVRVRARVRAAGERSGGSGAGGLGARARQGSGARSGWPRTRSGRGRGRRAPYTRR